MCFYCISTATECGGLLHFCCSKVWWSIAFRLKQTVVVYCNKVWWSIAFLLQSTAMQVALDHAPMHCTAFHRQLLLHLSYNWPMEKKLAGAVLSNFRSQYFRYLAAKCDLNTPALCFGWAQIYTHPLQHLFKNWLKADSDSPFVFLSFLPLSKKIEAPQRFRNKYLAERTSFLSFSVSLCLARSQNQLWHIEWPHLINVLHNTFNKLTQSIDPTAVLEIFL